MAVADTNYRFVYGDIGSYGKDCDSTIFKRSTPWTSVQTNMLELLSERPLSGIESPDVPAAGGSKKILGWVTRGGDSESDVGVG